MRTLPRFAATVCATMIQTRDFSSCAMPSTTMLNGTKVRSATSFVMSIAEKKLSAVSVSPMARTVFVRVQSLWASAENSPASRSPATTTMRQYNSASVLKSK